MEVCDFINIPTAPKGRLKPRDTENKKKKKIKKKKKKKLIK